MYCTLEPLRTWEELPRHGAACDDAGSRDSGEGGDYAERVGLVTELREWGL